MLLLCGAAGSVSSGRFLRMFLIQELVMLRSWLEVGFELPEDAAEEFVACGGAGDGVGFAREELEVVGDASVDEGLEELDGVGHVYVVVACALGYEETALDLGGVGDRGVGRVDVVRFWRRVWGGEA